MIEIELFHRDSEQNDNALRIWVGQDLVYAHHFPTLEQIVELRDNLHNELLWLNTYLREKGLE